ncbi:DUF4055 domain-containing protein [Janthinobacterium violaceinigrum]|uniref:DUF4055 domain-containing protein n=1 Tax=Janthinobacterium violaceinigrum TaxID=2654252 RepID=A0A6I1I965_9BURK|nr:DUF4055 domain-containing protein [Janthinobacterium violaceinigrum]KAB8066259.1 DUF4055 domain-containing protein [Janthinobacterium violaceinigrum]
MTDAVRKQSAEAAKLNEDCALIAALLGGTKTMRVAGKKYLPQWPGEDDKSYELRLAVATLFPAYTRTIDVLSAKPFSKPVTLGEDVPERLKPWLQNVDLSGRDLHSFLSEITQEAMGYGFAGILVDFPKAGNLVTKADEQAAGVRPYFVEVHVQNVLGWLPKTATSLEGLTQLRLLECVSEPDGDFDTKEIEQVRVLGRGTWQTWRQREAGSKKEWALYEEGVTTLKTIPFVPVYGKRLGYMQATPPLLELAHSNVEHWQSKSDQQNILHVARVPILFAKMLGEGGITVGAGSAVKSESPEGDLKFVEHGGKAIDAGRLSILDLEDRMRQAGAELLVIKPGNVTESQTLADNEQGACALQKIAGNVEDAGDQALQFMAEWVGEAEGGHITIFKDFGAASLAEASAELLLKSAASGKISGETYFNELQRRGILSPDLDWETEQERIQSSGPDLTGV